MAVIDLDDTTPRISYAVSSGGQTAFDVPFVFFDDEGGDLLVYVDDTLKTVTTHYTVSRDEDGTGTVTFVSSQASVTVTIVRDVPAERTTQFPESGPFSIADLNTELNRIVAMLQQELAERMRALVQPTSDSATIGALPAKASRASQYLAFDADGDPVAAADPDNYPASVYMGTVLQSANLAALLTALGLDTLTATQSLFNHQNFR